MAYKDAKVVLTQKQFSEAKGPQLAEWIGGNISVERAKRFLLQLISDGVIAIKDPQQLYEITYGRVMVEGTVLVKAAEEKKPVVTTSTKKTATKAKAPVKTAVEVPAAEAAA